MAAVINDAPIYFAKSPTNNLFANLFWEKYLVEFSNILAQLSWQHNKTSGKIWIELKIWRRRKRTPCRVTFTINFHFSSSYFCLKRNIYIQYLAVGNGGGSWLRTFAPPCKLIMYYIYLPHIGGTHRFVALRIMIYIVLDFCLFSIYLADWFPLSYIFFSLVSPFAL